MAESKVKGHVSVVIAGHVDSGKSTTTGRLLFELGGISAREMEKLTQEAEAMGKGSFKFAFYMDKAKESRERGITINYATKEFFTPNYHYTIVDAPGHKDFIFNFLSGSSTCDCAMLLVPADSGFIVSTQKGNHKSSEIQGQTRQHARLLNLLGVKQLIVCVNKMDDPTLAKYSQERFDEVRNEMKLMLAQVGWPKAQIENTPIIPISGWEGDNLIKKSEKMKWWNGVDVKVGKDTVHVDTVFDALDKFVTLPQRATDKPMRMPVSAVLKIKGVGDVITGRLEQGVIKPGDELVFVPSHTDKTPCTGRVFTVEMHHKSQPEASTGDNVGLNIKGLNKDYMPKKGDVCVLASDKSLQAPKKFTVQAQVISCVNEFKVGYTPIGSVRTAKVPCKLTAINWRMGKETNNAKVENPTCLKQNDMAELVFEPVMPMVVDKFSSCEGLGRIAFMDGNSVVMIGKVVSME